MEDDIVKTVDGKQIMTFTKDEQETIILYDAFTDTWSIETNVQKHINEIFNKYSNYNIEVTYVNKHGNPTSVRVNGLPKVITFRNIK